MIGLFDRYAPLGAREALVRELENCGVDVVVGRECGGTSDREVVALVGSVSDEARSLLARSPHVARLYRVSGPWVRTARAFRSTRTVVRIGDASIGAGEPFVIAGPCSVESPGQIEECARIVVDAGAQALRGGAHKPRTHPYAFQGLGREGLRLLKRAGDSVGLPVVSEIMDASHARSFVHEGIDCLQIGARNMQNFTLLKAVAPTGLPVLLKRGISGTVEEWLCAAEYLAAHGCERVILCERGIRTYETALRNTLDLAVVPLLRRLTHLPVLVDPSHAVGRRDLVGPASRGAIAVGADGLVLEMHPRPEEARSDGPQALLPSELAACVAEANLLARVLPELEVPAPEGEAGLAARSMPRTDGPVLAG
ncbi:Phospho-2-dehydro-3-deoxyheptonate aldolase [Planctomycetes bacterium Pla163]|uniref:Phospho-2-dehydro-3-deoxyheptonate aldolase n=1 Tax=Rohdeia mirabilis TaxID=2528008 RepID=A0A518CYR5_9BACT|nr:Phospho-2-dehydro-3-deoxyheptonate aldolase [Planctomycetes bacterium Pla163]